MAKILAIDDDSAVADLLRVRLGEAGHAVVAAGDAARALALAASEKPDLITLDVRMPEVDGIELYRRLRGQEGAARTPIIFVTGGDPAEILDSIPADPRVSFIDKPIDMDHLARMIAALVGYPAAGE